MARIKRDKKKAPGRILTGIAKRALVLAEKVIGRATLADHYSRGGVYGSIREAVIGDEWESGDVKWAKWRKLGGPRVVRGMTEGKIKSIRDAASALYWTNLLASGITEQKSAFLVGNGISITANHADEKEKAAAQECLDAFWKDEANAWSDLQFMFPSWLSLLGAQIYPAFVNQASGLVRLGYIDPEEVQDVICDPMNRRAVIAIRMRSKETSGASGGDGQDVAGKDFDPKKIIGNDPALLFRIINAPQRSALSPLGQHIEDAIDVLSEKLEGATRYTNEGISKQTQRCFYFRVNSAPNGTMGVSDLSTAVDYADALDATMMDEVDGARSRRSFVWDVTLEGMGKEEIDQWMQDNGQEPNPNEVIAHNENETWKSVAPNLNIGSSLDLMKHTQNVILGGNGIPQHWFADGGDVNRASAAEMAMPALSRLKARQFFLRNAYFAMGKFQLQEGVRSKKLPQSLDVEAFGVEMADLDPRDADREVGTLEKLTATLSVAEDRGWLSETSARRVFQSQLAEAGFEVDPEEEEAELEAQGNDQMAEMLKRVELRLDALANGNGAGGQREPDQEEATA